MKFTSKLLMLIFIQLCWNSLYAALYHEKTKEQEEQKRYIFGFNNRRAIVNQKNFLIIGMYAGIEFNQKHKIKLGLNGNLKPYNIFNHPSNLNNNKRILFFSIGEEYLIYKFRRFSLYTYTHLGIGLNIIDEFSETSLSTQREVKLILPAEYGLLSNYSLCRYTTFNFGFGFRNVFPNHNNLNGIFLKIGLNLNGNEFKKFKTESKR